MKKIIIYLRVSDSTGSDQLQAQETRIRAMLSKQGHEHGEALVIQDIACGADSNRPGWASVLQLLNEGGVNILATDDLACISPDWAVLEGLLWYVRRGLQVLTCTNGNESSIVLCIRNMMAMMSAFGNRHRIRRGMKAAALQGKAIGGPAYGYQAVNGTFQQEPEESNIVRGIYRTFVVEGWSPKKIAQKLASTGVLHRGKNKWNAGIIIKILRNPIYRGRKVWRDTPVDGQSHQQSVNGNTAEVAEVAALKIVPDDLWMQAQHLLK